MLQYWDVLHDFVHRPVCDPTFIIYISIYITIHKPEKNLIRFQIRIKLEYNFTAFVPSNLIFKIFVPSELIQCKN